MKDMERNKPGDLGALRKGINRVLTHPFKKKINKSSLLGIQNIPYPLGDRNGFRRIRRIFFLFLFLRREMKAVFLS